MLPQLTVIREGSTSLCVPAESLAAREPSKYPVFFNQAARVNRDVSVAIAHVTKPSTFLDALAGVGARGVRVANEASKTVRVTLVEFNEASLKLARRNARRNRVEGRCEMVHKESNAYLHSRFGRAERFEAVDVDPFGTPAPYVQGALAAVEDGGIISVTATDTATLCGVFPSAALRRYGARVARGEFPHEAGVRVLFGFCARVGGLIDVGIEPIAAHSTLHYLRAYFRVARGAQRSDRSLKEIGYVSSCPGCHENTVTAGRLEDSCPSCGGGGGALTGPLWTGKLVDEGVVGAAARYAGEREWKGAAHALAALHGCDSFPPFGYSMEAITSREKISSVRQDRVVESLRSSGRSAMRQPFGSSSSKGLKTNASYKELIAAVRDSAAL